MKKQELHYLSEEFLQILDFIYGDSPDSRTKSQAATHLDDQILKEYEEDLSIVAIASNSSKKQLKKLFKESKKRVAGKLNLPPIH